MAVNAKDLPGLFTASTWVNDHVLHDSTDKWISSVDGLWGLSPESDLFRVPQAVFDAIAGATVENGGPGPYLVVSGETREVYGYPSGGYKWIGLREPE